MGWKRNVTRQVDPTWLKPPKHYCNVGIHFPMPAEQAKLDERIAFVRALLEPAGWTYLGCAPHPQIPRLAETRFERAPDRGDSP